MVSTHTTQKTTPDYMLTPRYMCLATVLPGHKLMVVGGQSKINDTITSEATDNIEIATVE